MKVDRRSIVDTRSACLLKLGGWAAGRLGGWAAGRLGGWAAGRLGGWASMTAALGIPARQSVLTCLHLALDTDSLPNARPQMSAAFWPSQLGLHSCSNRERGRRRFDVCLCQSFVIPHCVLVCAASQISCVTPSLVQLLGHYASHGTPGT